MKNLFLLLLIPLFFLANTKTFAQNCLTIWSSSEIVQSGDTAQLDIQVKDFDNLIAMQYSMAYDPQKLELISIENFNLQDLNGSNFGNFPDDGIITFAWFDFLITGLSVPDNTVIYSLKFKVMHSNGTASTLSFEDGPTSVEVIQLTPNGDLPLGPSFFDGQIYAGTNQGINYPAIESICSTASGCIGNDAVGSIELSASGGMPPYTYAWESSSGASYTTEDLSDVPIGTYELTVTDQNGLEASALTLLAIDNPFPLAVEAVLYNATCGDGANGAIELTISGGSGSYNIQWDSGATAATIDNLAPGAYEVTITDSSNGCSIVQSYTINLGANFNLDVNVIHPSCGENNGSIAIIVSTPGDYSYAWDNGATTSTITDLGVGTYQVTVTDITSGCEVTETIHLIIEDFIPGTSYQCEFFDNNVVIVSPTVVVWSGGQAPYTFSWSDGTVETVDAFPAISTIQDPTFTTEPHIYTVTITDGSGCVFPPVTIEADCNNSSDEVEIYTNTTAVDVGESFCVDVQVGNFTDILSMQFSINWEPAILQFDSVSNYILPNGSGNNFGDPDILGPGILTFSWLDNATAGVSLADNTSIFQLCFTAVGEGNTNIDFTNSPTPIEIINLNMDEVQLNVGNNLVTVSEALGNFDFAIEQPTCGQANGSIEIIVLEPGDYSYSWNTGASTSSLSGLSAGLYQVTITDNNTSEATTYPIELTETDFLSALSFECQFFDNDSVNINMTIGVWNGGIPPYTFEWSDGTMETDPFSSTLPISVHVNDDPSYMVTVTDATGCMFEPVLVEPVCVNPNELHLSAPDVSAEIGETVCLDITATGFNDIASLQFSMSWDASTLQFESLQDFGLPFLTENNFNAESELMDGMLRFSWLDNATTGQTLSDNSVLFQLCLTVVDGSGLIPIQFANTPIPQEAINGDLEEVDVITDDGSVTVTPDGFDGVQLSIGSDIGIPGQEVCLPVICQDFNDIASVQFSINWDPSIIDYADIHFGDLPALSSSNFGLLEVNEGELRFSWLDQAVSGVTLADGTMLFEICFTPSGPAGVSPVSFSNTPIPIEVTNGDAMIVDFLGTDGEVSVPDNLVWPGDTDASEAVNHFDLLNIGLAYGSSGPARTDASIDWMAQYAEDWAGETAETGINFKHADTDGNGLIDANDTLAIIQNWGEVTEFWDGEGENRNTELISSDNAPIYILPDTIVPGATVDFSIILGNDDSPAMDVYGLAFTIIYDPDVIVENSVSAQFTDSWLGDVNNNLLGIYRDNYGNNRIDIAVTRTDLNNVSGQGMIGSLKVTIEDVIFLRNEAYEMNFEIENVRLIDAQELEIPVSPLVTESLIIEETTNVNEPEWARNIQLFPIPAKDQLQLIAEDHIIESLQLFGMEGRLLEQFDPKNNTMNIAHLPAGAYLLQIITEQGVVVRRIEKL